MSILKISRIGNPILLEKSLKIDKIPDENITLSLNMDYSKSVDKLKESKNT